MIWNEHCGSDKIRKNILCRGVCSSWISWKYLCKNSNPFGVRNKAGEAFANFSLRVLFKWLFIFFTTHRKIISNEVITGALSQRIILLLLGMFPILVTITSYKKYLYGRFFPLWKQITLTHLNDLEVFLCSSALIMHWNWALHFAEIRRTQTSPNIYQSVGKQGTTTKEKSMCRKNNNKAVRNSSYTDSTAYIIPLHVNF